MPPGLAPAQLLSCMGELNCNLACNFHGKCHMQSPGLLAVQAELRVAHSGLGGRCGGLGDGRAGLRHSVA